MTAPETVEERWARYGARCGAVAVVVRPFANLIVWTYALGMATRGLGWSGNTTAWCLIAFWFVRYVFVGFMRAARRDRGLR